MSNFSQTLSIIREKSINDNELGISFEQLSKVFLENDDIQVQEYSDVWFYKDWAQDKPKYSNIDIGIDLVAKLKYEDGYCAVQCKCYKEDHSISKADLDSFISASSTDDFRRLMLIDTSIKPLSNNAQKVFDNLNKDFIRIQNSELSNSRIDWKNYVTNQKVSLNKKKDPFDHQIKAINAVSEHFKESDRGKLIMACGTGKTFTALRIAEKLAGPGKVVLYMVPSLSLMSQTIREWKKECSTEFIAFSACSDKKIGKKKKSDDLIDIEISDLAFPATTDPKKLANQLNQVDRSLMTVVFSTYHSIDVVSSSQFQHGVDFFDLIICDEAHRTTGATLNDEDESNFVKIHRDSNIKGRKRLYMTATPKIYGEKAKKKEEEGLITLASMNDESLYGSTIFQRGFSWAVENNLLSDYKVVVLMMDEEIVSNTLQKSFTEGSELALDDVTKIIGCYKALAKIGLNESKINDQENIMPMKRALAFCQNIKLSKVFSKEFKNVVDDYLTSNSSKQNIANEGLNVQTSHIDGSFNAEERNAELTWLQEETPEDVCRVISNARCLSEGVDVPSLDAIIFAHPRRSQIDVVQSVGRVMRKAKGKELGYVILPIAVAPGVTAKKALDDNERYEIIWQILNALRAHDERFDSTINRISLGEDVSNRLEIVDGTSLAELEATTAVVDDVKSKRKKDPASSGNSGQSDESGKKNEEEQLSLNITELSSAILAKIVKKCGTRDYWENWANDIALIAEKHITRINSIVLNSGTPERNAFLKFLEEIQDDLNPEITERDAVEMIAQHIITKPVFDSLFAGNKFTAKNPFSVSMEKILSQIYNHKIDTENKSLEKFYKSVQLRCKDIISAQGRQKLIVELYDRFFRKAFPLMTQKLGLVYTPIEVVDFIIHSIEYIMKNEFDSSLGQDNVNILDPFTGTGTFISRLLQSKILSKEQIKKKYLSEIHANEIILLAYYIACINIESIYADFFKEDDYKPFSGIVLTDTFQLYEQERDMIANLLPDNSQRRTNQKSKNISVIFGNPPYSVGQKSSNDDAKNTIYRNLDAKINETYVSHSKATNKRGLYDSYIRAFRWASDRLHTKGVIGFVSGGAWVERQFADGMRFCLQNEFSKIYVINLRGDIRKNMISKGIAGEGENIFGQGSMNGISISLLVKNDHSHSQQIYYFDVGDNLKIEEKKEILYSNKSIETLIKENKFISIKPDKNNDWLDQRREEFGKYIPLGNKKDKSEITIFDDYAIGIDTNRDNWCYNFSKKELRTNINKTIDFYNAQLEKNIKLNSVDKNPKFIKWSSSFDTFFKRGEKLEFDENEFYIATFKPFIKTNLYREKKLIHRISKWRNIFPDNKSENLAIGISGIGSRSEFSVLMTNNTSSRNCLENCQYFPLYLYKSETEKPSLFNFLEKSKENKIPAISEKILSTFSDAYPNLRISYEDIFYYVYGILHSKDYRKTFKTNLNKEIPRIPILKSEERFGLFAKAGKSLSDIHVNFENVEKYPLNCEFQLDLVEEESNEKYFVEKMKFASSSNQTDKSKIIVNKYITLSNIPLNAYEYTISNRSAIEHVMDRFSIRNDKSSGIINDPNNYSMEVLKNPKYPVELIQRMVTVSLETLKIINSLPKID